jgi:ABC-type phosphate/phosphonate transport system substrate-binding protein
MIANARMYAIDDAVAAAWRRLFEWIAREADVPLDVVAHAAPLPLADLWLRPDLGCALMCGFPWASWSKSSERPTPLVVPVPSPPAFGGEPIYWTDIIARADSGLASASDLEGLRFAVTVEESQSGYQAPRHFFADPARVHGGRLFAAAVGPLYTPRRVVEAVLANEADAGPLDAWWHALLRRHEPTLAARLRTVATTRPAPIPLVVCSAGVENEMRQRLIAAFERVENVRELADIRDSLLLARFVRPKTMDYESLTERARAADALGYHRLQ